MKAILVNARCVIDTSAAWDNEWFHFFGLSLFSLMCQLAVSFSVCVFVEMDRNLDPGETEEVIPHLHRELQEAQELANTGKQKCLELQGTFAC